MISGIRNLEISSNFDVFFIKNKLNSFLKSLSRKILLISEISLSKIIFLICFDLL